jgi:hypothetical protein
MKRKVLRAVLIDREAITLLRKYKVDNKLKNLGDAIRKLIRVEEIDKELDDELDLFTEDKKNERSADNIEPDEPVYPPI